MGFSIITTKQDMSEVRAYVTVYLPVAGWKGVLLVQDEDCDMQHTPWETGMWAFGSRKEAIHDALCWAEAEDVPFYLSDPTDEEKEVIKTFVDGIKVTFTHNLFKSNNAQYDYTCADDKLLLGQLLTLEGHSRPYFVKAIREDGLGYDIRPVPMEDEEKQEDTLSACFPCNRPTCHECPEQKK